jgi:two-component system sensor histidine kinase TctE
LLAIVRAVAEAHGATVELLDRPGGGLTVRLEFEAAPARVSSSPALCRAAVVAVMLTLWLPPALSAAAAPHIYTAPTTEHARLRIYGATDPQAIAAPDVVISSAVDLQVNLINDGYTQPHCSAATEALPDWANWRDEAFGFTYEPAVIAYNREQVPEAEVPRSRPALIRLLQTQAERYRRRVATYDIARSGVGYLFAAEDEVQSGGSFWRLMLSLGQDGVHLACCTGDVLAAIERGEVLLGYILLGSYARAPARRRANRHRAAAGLHAGDRRVAVIPAQARNPVLAGQFTDYLLSARGQTVIARAPACTRSCRALPANSPPTGRLRRPSARCSRSHSARHCSPSSTAQEGAIPRDWRLAIQPHDACSEKGEPAK